VNVVRLAGKIMLLDDLIPPAPATSVGAQVVQPKQAIPLLNIFKALTQVEELT
jgi:hypothetical protein